MKYAFAIFAWLLNSWQLSSCVQHERPHGLGWSPLLSWAFLASRSQELPGKWKCRSLSHVHTTTGFSRQEHCGGLSFPAPGHLPDPEADSESPLCQADSLLSEPPRKPSSGLASSVAKYRSIFTPLGAKIREGEGRGAQGHHCLDLAHLNSDKGQEVTEKN